jgi:hypothetical protein
MIMWPVEFQAMAAGGCQRAARITRATVMMKGKGRDMDR